ncbi:MAG: thiamine diphosphokinase [Eubacteriales bacterium]|nr:thiamine diphosphokinase [Eubacteriales bacterium]
MNTQPICTIVCALPLAVPPEKRSGDLVIAADAGYRNLGGVAPDYVVGDFDSLGYVPEGERVLRHPPEKDDTDTMLAARLGLSLGYRAFVLLGGLGGRLDHTLANLQTLAFLRANGAKACLAGEGETVTLIENETLRFRAGLSGTVSVFAYGASARGVFERGLKYPLTDAHLTDDFPLGVSNAFTGAPALVSVSQGRLLVLYGAGILDSDLFSETPFEQPEADESPDL